MPHARKQIRDAVVAALTGLATTGTKVFQSRVNPLANGKLPGLALFTQSETADYLTMRLPRTQERKLTVGVEIYVKGVANYDDSLDQIALEVEAAIYADVTLGGIARDTVIRSFNADFNGDGDQPVCAATMSIEVTYVTLEGAAGTLV